jgi:hypothetical protein
MNTERGPAQPPVDRAALKGQALARLRQRIWETAQFMETDEIKVYVSAVLAEIDSDAP